MSLTSRWQQLAKQVSGIVLVVTETRHKVQLSINRVTFKSSDLNLKYLLVVRMHLNTNDVALGQVGLMALPT